MRAYTVMSRNRAEARDLQNALARRGFADFALTAATEDVLRAAGAQYEWRFRAALSIAELRQLILAIVDGDLMGLTLRRAGGEGAGGCVK